MVSIKELLFKIKQRPSMYISCNTISCLKAYIDGWMHRDLNNITDMELFDEFQDWVVKKFNVRGSQSFAQIILFYSLDEYAALKQFFELFDEFLSIRSGGAEKSE